MWAFCVQHKDGKAFIPSGNDGAMLLTSKTPEGLYKETEQLRKNGYVYLMKDYTQKMCEMDSERLARYVILRGFPMSLYGRSVWE